MSEDTPLWIQMERKATLLEEELETVKLQLDESEGKVLRLAAALRQIQGGALGNAGRCMHCDSIALVAHTALASS